ncbi:hypothetical protein [Pannonibacter sp. SL95]|uniref:hypothetical protein n=1 Tax=Pannonibacter sp. SL95 TaxID=2995153 RepID=UPI00227529DC|nr:hypothetical protein [Pannonibacter sp. SL95]MCY1708355.1 hypothetical protein [Pannonibacter sp. SL95]
MRHAGTEFRRLLNDTESPLAQELKHMHVLVPEERLFRDDFDLDSDRLQVGEKRAVWDATDFLLDKGQRLQGYLSGFNSVRNIQQRIAVTSATDKLFRHLSGIDKASTDRFADWGISDALAKKLETYVANGTVEFKDNHLHKLNFQKWSDKDVDEFTYAINRHMNQVVQRALAGESSVLFHKNGLMALMWHLKSFPMLAIQKQFMRHARIADKETVAAFIASMITAGAVVAAKDGINGRDSEDLVKRAFGMSNLTGWIPMWTDPVASMLGMDNLKFNEYARGVDAGVIAVPAALPTLNRMLHAPSAMQKVQLDRHSNSDIYALQALPIVGNLYGFSYMWNAMKD